MQRHALGAAGVGGGIPEAVLKGAASVQVHKGNHAQLFRNYRRPAVAAIPLVLICLFTGRPADAEVRFGLKAGVPLSAYFDTGVTEEPGYRADYSAATRRYTFGPSIEWRTRPALGIELDALFHRMGYVAIIETPAGRSAIDTKGNSWDFPLTVKYRFARSIQPYVLGGAIVRYIEPIRGRGEATLNGVRTQLDTTDPSEVRKRLYPGLTAAAGLEFGRHRLRWLPEVRYTHWTSNISVRGGRLRFMPGQVEVLVGVLF